MADFDVQPVGLTSPPVVAFLTAYRPAVATRNNGIHPADVTGLLRIYNATTGLLIFTCNLAVLSVPPGETRDALGDANWTPEEIGDYQVIASCTTDHDQVPANNNLSPVIIHVSEEPPPPPPPVEPHAPQHEAGGTDQLNLDGMHGTLADDQPVATHKASHQEAGDDELNVQDLHGTLADEQPVGDHGSAKHDGTVPDLVDGKVPVEQLPDMPVGEHGNPEHDATVEATAHKGQPDGYADLNGAGLVPAVRLAVGPDPAKFLRGDQTWQPGVAPPFGTPVLAVLGERAADGVSADTARADHQHSQQGPISHEHEINSLPAGGYNLLTKTVNAGWCQQNEDVIITADVHGELYFLEPGDTVQLDLRYGDTIGGTYPTRASLLYTAQEPVEHLNFHVHLVASQLYPAQILGRAHGTFALPGASGPAHAVIIPSALGSSAFNTGLTSQMKVDVTIISGGPAAARYITTRLDAQYRTSAP